LVRRRSRSTASISRVGSVPTAHRIRGPGGRRPATGRTRGTGRPGSLDPTGRAAETAMPPRRAVLVSDEEKSTINKQDTSIRPNGCGRRRGPRSITAYGRCDSSRRGDVDGTTDRGPVRVRRPVLSRPHVDRRPTTRRQKICHVGPEPVNAGQRAGTREGCKWAWPPGGRRFGLVSRARPET
jgi:hypothetical protein